MFNEVEPVVEVARNRSLMEEQERFCLSADVELLRCPRDYPGMTFATPHKVPMEAEEISNVGRVDDTSLIPRIAQLGDVVRAKPAKLRR